MRSTVGMRNAILGNDLKHVRFSDADGNWKWAVLTFHLHAHNHIHIAKYLFAIRNEKYKNLGERACLSPLIVRPSRTNSNRLI